MTWSESTRAARMRRLQDVADAVAPPLRTALAATTRADEYAASTLTRALFPAPWHPAGGSTGTSVTPIRELLVMPVGDRCNLACRYCYEATRREAAPEHRMTLDALRRILENVLPYVRPPFLLAWHGGEPLLMGRRWFEDALALVREIAGGDWVMTAVQTNATMIDREWAALLRDHRVGVGVSLDGPPAAHDAVRVARDGGSTHATVVRGIAALQQADVAFGTIAVVSAPAAGQPGSAAALFDYFQELGIDSYDVHPACTHTAAGQALNLSPEPFAGFMIDLFEQWLAEGDPRIRIGFFEHFFQGMTGQRPDTCYLSGACTSVLGVGPQGVTLPCTRPFDPAYTFGNLADSPLPEVLRHPAFLRFQLEESAARRQLGSCEWAGLCAAGCPHDRVDAEGQRVDGTNVYCTCRGDGRGGYPAIFTYMRNRIEELLELEPAAPTCDSGRGSRS